MPDETDRTAEAMAAAAAEAAEADEEDDEEDESGAEAAEAEGAKRAQPGLYISTPPVLKERIEQEAAAVGKTPRAYVRDLLAEKWSLVLPEARTRTKYKNDEEKLAAQKEKREARQSLIKRLLAEHREAQAKAAAEANLAAGASVDAVEATTAEVVGSA